MAEQSKCGSCGAAIQWVEMAKSGKKNPLDAVPVANGNVHIREDGKAVVLNKEELAKHTGDLFLSHFATCKNAAHHRKS